MEIHEYAETHLQPMEETHTGAGGCPRVAVTLWETHPGKICGSMERGAHTGAGLLAGLVTLWGNQQSIPEGLHPAEETCSGAVRGELQAVGRFHVGEIPGGLSCMGGDPMLEQVKDSSS
ncbi:hypothetical protein DUI87_08082 [Hirundo rustica rustica]|uniref:Uncharacterized protein n=1 Tax=Hirundo rustica rustica TaxID=333673 RepID=A0A3M0L9F3_HIRRU|nr:hypothetical protein DUI87_08082 [Hirundo rustica rustica]